MIDARMATERKTRGGVPANTNLFCVVEDIHLGDGLAVSEAGPYLVDDQIPYAPVNITCPALSREEAERLVGDVCHADPQDSIAVIAEYRHTIPEHMRGFVPVVRSNKVLKGLCQSDDTYYTS